MTPRPVMTRRVLLRDMGKAGLAFVVLGVAACAPSTEPGTSTSAPPGTTGAGGDTTTSRSDATTTSPNEGTGRPDHGYRWARANLGFVSAYVLYRSGEAVVVDTGVTGSVNVIEAALTGVGLDWDQVGHVVITHKHSDHQGSLPAVLAQAPEADWYAGAGDIGEITAPRGGSIAGDGDSVLGLDIVETPGHTPGHISVLDPAGGILVVGDAVNGAEGGMVGANPRFSDDMGRADDSVRKLAGFDYEVILFGHGEPLTTGGSAAMSALADSLG